MKILQVVSSARISGAEKHVVVLSERLRERGHEVMAVCPHGDWLPGQLRDASVPVTEMDMRGFSSFTAPGNLARFVREQGIDIIHAHLTRATYMGLLAGRKTQVPFVSSVHCRTHDVAYRFLFPRRRAQIVTVSDFIRNGLLKKGVPESRVRTIYNGTEFCSQAGPGRYEADSGALPVRAELSLPPESELIGLFGHVGEFKGHYVLAKAAQQIVAARPSAYIVCVGTVEPAVQRALWEIASTAGVAERLRFTGQRNDVQRLMSAMDVVTLPSRYEACSMSIIEAMAMEKVVVASRAGGNPELITDGETGYLIERTPQALASAVIRALEDPGQSARIGSAAGLIAARRFSADVMVQQIEKVYQDLLAEPIGLQAT